MSNEHPTPVVPCDPTALQYEARLRLALRRTRPPRMPLPCDLPTLPPEGWTRDDQA